MSLVGGVLHSLAGILHILASALERVAADDGDRGDQKHASAENSQQCHMSTPVVFSLYSCRA
jgi:hypothetical protein